jgi:hypothetical protein
MVNLEIWLAIALLKRERAQLALAFMECAQEKTQAWRNAFGPICCRNNDSRPGLAPCCRCDSQYFLPSKFDRSSSRDARQIPKLLRRYCLSRCFLKIRSRVRLVLSQDYTLQRYSVTVMFLIFNDNADRVAILNARFAKPTAQPKEASFFDL